MMTWDGVCKYVRSKYANLVQACVCFGLSLLGCSDYKNQKNQTKVLFLFLKKEKQISASHSLHSYDFSN